KPRISQLAAGESVARTAAISPASIPRNRARAIATGACCPPSLMGVGCLCPPGPASSTPRANRLQQHPRAPGRAAATPQQEIVSWQPAVEVAAQVVVPFWAGPLNEIHQGVFRALRAGQWVAEQLRGIGEIVRL